MEKLNELVELAKKATPGEWTADWYDDDRGYVTWYIDLERQRAAFFLADGGPELNGTGNPSDFDKADCNFIAAANPATILAIAEAFRALEQRVEEEKHRADQNAAYLEALTDRMLEAEQRVEAAEAKLAELEKQEPVAYSWRSFKKAQLTRTMPESWKQPRDIKPLFTRPALAINLAELVLANAPIEVVENMDEVLDVHICDSDMQAVWSVCRAAILRKIEEASK